MAAWDKNTVWSFMFLLTGAVGPSVPRVDYQHPVCAVKGSTVTVLCSFTPAPSVTVIRVVWCQKHEICQGETPSVYDSDSEKNDPRYKYLGDKKTNCTLQISDVRKEDGETLRFRMETDDPKHSFTGRWSAVKLTVKESTELKVDSSAGDRQVRGGETVTLSCTARCTIHQLEVTWFRDGHALSGSGPALWLSSLTAGHSGNYTCGLKSVSGSRSPPYSLQVEEEGRRGGVGVALIAVAVFGVLLALLVPVVVVGVVRRRRAAADPGSVGGKVEQPPDNVYSNVLPKEEAAHRRETGPPAVEDVSYASVQFRHENRSRALQNEQDSTIYSTVVSRG